MTVEQINQLICKAEYLHKILAGKLHDARKEHMINNDADDEITITIRDTDADFIQTYLVAISEIYKRAEVRLP